MIYVAGSHGWLGADQPRAEAGGRAGETQREAGFAWRANGSEKALRPEKEGSYSIQRTPIQRSRVCAAVGSPSLGPWAGLDSERSGEFAAGVAKLYIQVPESRQPGKHNHRRAENGFPPAVNLPHAAHQLGVFTSIFTSADQLATLVHPCWLEHNDPNAAHVHKRPHHHRPAPSTWYNRPPPAGKQHPCTVSILIAPQSMSMPAYLATACEGVGGMAASIRSPLASVAPALLLTHPPLVMRPCQQLTVVVLS